MNIMRLFTLAILTLCINTPTTHALKPLIKKSTVTNIYNLVGCTYEVLNLIKSVYHNEKINKITYYLGYSRLIIGRALELEFGINRLNFPLALLNAENNERRTALAKETLNREVWYYAVNWFVKNNLQGLNPIIVNVARNIIIYDLNKGNDNFDVNPSFLTSCGLWSFIECCGAALREVIEDDTLKSKDIETSA